MFRCFFYIGCNRSVACNCFDKFTVAIYLKYVPIDFCTMVRICCASELVVIASLVDL